ncbi:hypothetical protein EDC04DRAFT_2597657 [Pisolithus marmoratus]|nr:hypothetical protein EDC04DRAFT_2597657 [Pisolithus marmoratus]
MNTRTDVGQKRENEDSDEIPHPHHAHPCLDNDNDGPQITSEEDELEIQHKQTTAQGNFGKVNFGQWQMLLWCVYLSIRVLCRTAASRPPSPPCIPYIVQWHPPKATQTSRPTHRKSQVFNVPLSAPMAAPPVLAGGLTRLHLTGEKSVLWYITDGPVWEMYVRKCDRRHPPGRKVYQRGANTTWEVAGAIGKLYCQNLTLFVLFYILIDAGFQCDHVLGFFSKATNSLGAQGRLCARIDGSIRSNTLAKRNVYRDGSPDAVDILTPYTTSPAPARLAAIIPNWPLFPPGMKRAPKGFDEEPPHTPISPTFHRYTPRSPTTTSATMPICMPIPIPTQAPEAHNALTSIRKVITTSNPSGSATSHVVVRLTILSMTRMMLKPLSDAVDGTLGCTEGPIFLSLFGVGMYLADRLHEIEPRCYDQGNALPARYVVRHTNEIANQGYTHYVWIYSWPPAMQVIQSSFHAVLKTNKVVHNQRKAADEREPVFQRFTSREPVARDDYSNQAVKRAENVDEQLVLRPQRSRRTVCQRFGTG